MSGEQEPDAVDLEIAALRENLAVAQAQVRDLTAALATERAQVASLTEMAATEEREACARAVEMVRPGRTLDVFTGRLVTDEDGPWGLPSEFAAAIRARGVK